MQFSVDVRNAMLEAYEATIGASAQLWWHSGGLPVNCAAPRTGTQILDTNLPADYMAPPSNGSKAIAGSWSAATMAAGLPGYYSIMNAAGTVCHDQGLISMPYANSLPVLLNQQIHVGSNVYKVTTAGATAASGSGPSGSGTAITDGTAVFDYIGPRDMSVDNSNVTLGQVVTVTSKTLIAPNA